MNLFISFFLLNKIFLFSKLILLINEKVLFSMYTKIFNFLSIFYNYYYLTFFSVNYFQNTYIFNYILLKKQNSFLKKKINLINNFYNVFQKSNKIIDRHKNFKNINFFLKFYKLNYNLKINLNTQKVIDLRKKLKKLVLENRKFVNFSVFKNTVRSYRLTK